MNTPEGQPVAEVHCSHPGCGFSPQSIPSLRDALNEKYVGGNITWLKGRKERHDRQTGHEAILNIFDPRLNGTLKENEEGEFVFNG